MALRIASTAYNQDLKPEKLEQAVLFFLHRINNQYLGRTKLMRLLYYADFDYFEEFDMPLTGARYRKLPHGPVPDDAERVIQEMIDSGLVQSITVPLGDRRQERLEPLVPVDEDVFTSREIDVLGQVASRWERHSTSQIEAASHGEAPWLAVSMGEIIPYEMAYYRNNFGEMELDPEEKAVLAAPDDAYPAP